MLTPEKMTKMRHSGLRGCCQAETGTALNAKDKMAALINPESYAHDYKLKFANTAQGQGTSGQQMKFEMVTPQEMTFEFLFDNTGIIDGRPRLDISDDLEKFKDLMIGFHGETHQPYYIKLAWGTNAVFIGRAHEFSINY
ncbi:MAG: LysM peptidoglycan-binding domain-containing protein, partial [Sphingopyxis sp.]|nr:LysM peptidoglycan-binding domain-containing protein [Sphingopyxis sp.]